jgi:uncharacterized protein (DUF1501 family)
MKRRDFIKNLALAAAFAPVYVNGLPVRALSASAFPLGELDDNGRVLVLIQLNGGNDGLNTVIPLDQYARLSTARSNILIPENRVLKLTDETGLHPSMAGVWQLYKDEKVAVIQSAGYPEPNFSHFRSTDIWTSASDSKEVSSTGWLGRYLNLDHPAYPDGYPGPDHPHPLAITIGSLVSNTCQGPASNFSIAISDLSGFDPLQGTDPASPPVSLYGKELSFIRQSMDQANRYAGTIQNAAAAAANLSPAYPDPGANTLADQLKIVARLIAGGLQSRIYVAQLGGFDTHAGQAENGDPLSGKHAELLSQVSEAIWAFQDDLGRMGIEERVVGLTFSEFGRRIKSNGSRGTDHGAAAPMFVFGSEVCPGLLGNNPEIPDKVTVRDSVPMQFDFRSVFGSLLTDWFGLDQQKVRTVLSPSIQYLPFLNREFCGAIGPDRPLLLLQNYPNPFSQFTTLRFLSLGGPLDLSIYDARGSRILTVIQGDYPAGDHRIEIQTEGWSPGNYYARIQQGDLQQMIRMACTGR